jgi:hypothetical protein
LSQHSSFSRVYLPPHKGLVPVPWLSHFFSFSTVPRALPSTHSPMWEAVIFEAFVDFLSPIGVASWSEFLVSTLGVDPWQALAGPQLLGFECGVLCTRVGLHRAPGEP